MLNDREKSCIQELIDRSTDAEDLTVEAVEGFLSALAITPQPAPPEEWFAFLFGEEGPAFDDEEQANTLGDNLMDAYDRLRDRHATGELLFPFDLEQHDVEALEPVFDWTYGFHEGLTVGGDYWDEVAGDEAVDHALMVVEAIAHPERADEIFTYRPREELRDDEGEPLPLEAVLLLLLPQAVADLIVASRRPAEQPIRLQ